MPTNASALSQLLIAERPSLLRRLVHIVGNETAAEDITQAMWLRIQRIEDEPPIDNKRSYLFRLASNLAIDHVRAESTRSSIQAEAHALLWAGAEQPGPEQTALAGDELDRVLKAAARLPEPTRGIFRMHRFEGLKQSEVAARFGVSVTTVEKHVRRALTLLREARDKP